MLDKTEIYPIYHELVKRILDPNKISVEIEQAQFSLYILRILSSHPHLLLVFTPALT